MAAFERISKVIISPINLPRGQQSPETDPAHIDIRTAKLPLDRPPVDDFDPREHRDPKVPIKPWMATFIIWRCVYSAAVLPLPTAVSMIGIILGPIIIVAAGLLMIHMHLTLLWCLNEISRQLKIPYVSYRYGFRIALLHGPPLFHPIAYHGPKLVACFMISCQIGICAICIVLTGDNVRDIMDWETIFPALAWLFIPFLLVEIFVKSMKVLSYISLVGSFMTALGMGLIIVSCFKDPHGYMTPVSNNVMSFFLGLGIILFNLSNIGIILACDKSLKDPTQLTKRFGTVTTGIGLSTISAAIFGSLGYWSFGAMEENVLRSLPYDEPLSQVIFGVYLVTITFLYPVQCLPGVAMFLEVIKNMDPRHTPTDKSMQIIESVTRPLFVVVTFVVAYFLPFQASLVAFVGSLCTNVLALIGPAMMELCLLYPYDYGRFHYLLIKDLVILILGLLTWIIGIYLTGYHLYILFIAMNSPNDSQFK